MSQPQSVLLIDNRSERRAEIAALVRTQYEVQEFATCQLAKEAVDSQTACVIIAGDATGDPAGRDAMIAMAPVIAVVSDPADTEAALTAGCFDCLTGAELPPFRLLHSIARATELTQLRRTVANQADDIATAKRELQEFAYAISHDLQEPLRSIIGFCGLLEKEAEGALSESGQRFLGIVVQCGYRAKQMIEDLLKYSRIESRGEPLQPTPAANCVSDATQSLQSAIRSSGAEITCGELPAIQADYWQIVTLIEELIGNAIKFRREETPQIRIQATRQGDLVEFSVADNGIGMEERFQEDVFKVFRRLHTREEYPGTGIGLAICKRIVERHGGTIRIDASGESGAIVYLTLPVSVSEA